MDQSTSPFNPAEKNILVVEDEPSGRSLLAAALKRAGYQFVLCMDGQEAVEQFREQAHAIDLVLMVGMSILSRLTSTS
jgi:CheY-like chemotaxis protein